MDYLEIGLVVGWSAWALMTTFRLNSHARALDKLKVNTFDLLQQWHPELINSGAVDTRMDPTAVIVQVQRNPSSAACDECVHFSGINHEPCIRRAVYLHGLEDGVEVVTCPHRLVQTTIQGSTRDCPPGYNDD